MSWMPNQKTKTEWKDTKTGPLYMLSTRDPPQTKGHIQIESEGLEKDISFTILRKFSTIISSSIFSCPFFLSSFAGILMVWMLGHLTLSQRSLRLSSFLFILFSFFLSASFISTSLSSTSLILSSTSIILLLVPSRVLLLPVIALLLINSSLFLLGPLFLLG